MEVSKPCIDMQDEGYNCEWSQELKVEQVLTVPQCLVAIHILTISSGLAQVRKLFLTERWLQPGGHKKANVQWFLDRMTSCETELKTKINLVRPIYPAIDSILIPPQLSNSITLSTMHGCPANEIEGIARYLLTERKLHTLVKLNPTLLGRQELRRILNDELKFKTSVPGCCL